MKVKKIEKRPSLRTQEERNKLVEENLGLVYGFVNRFFRSHPGVSKIYPREDAESDGVIGLIRACELYDEDKGYKLSTYVGYWVFNQLMERLRCNDMIRTPRDGKLPRKKIHQFPDNSGFDVKCTLDDAVTRNEIKDIVWNSLNCLPKHYAEVVRLRLNGLTLQGIADVVGTSKEWVRQIEYRSYRRLFKSLIRYKGQI